MLQNYPCKQTYIVILLTLATTKLLTERVSEIDTVCFTYFFSFFVIQPTSVADQAFVLCCQKLKNETANFYAETFARKSNYAEGICENSKSYFSKMGFACVVYSVHVGLYYGAGVNSRSVFERYGTKLSLQSGIKFLQTIYIDASWWVTPIHIQQNTLQDFSLVVGAKMQM